MAGDYFHRVHAQSPTRFWVNNPTRTEADQAIAAGAVSCTTNPAYAMKEIQRESEYALQVVDRVIEECADDATAVDLVQQRLVKPILDKFRPLHAHSSGEQGWVSIQGNPLADGDADHIVDEALRYRRLAENYIAKIPVTRAGLQAIDLLVREGIPVIATEVMGLAQAVAACETYQRASASSGKHPAFYLTHITGIFDEYLGMAVKREGIPISSDVLWQAGCIVVRRQYRLFKERGYPGTMLGGGARGLHHFTEMVGSEMHVTINWTGCADSLIAADPPVVYRMFNPAPQHVVDELLAQVPDFRRAYLEDGLTIDEFAEFGPVQLFRNSFIQGWNYVLDTIKARRSAAT